MYGERIPPLAALDIDRADHGVVLGRPDALQRHHMLAGEVVHQRVVAVVGDEAGERIVGLQLKRLLLRHAQDRLVLPVEGVLARNLAPLDRLHRLFSPGLWSSVMAALTQAGEPRIDSLEGGFGALPPHPRGGRRSAATIA